MKLKKITAVLTALAISCSASAIAFPAIGNAADAAGSSSNKTVEQLLSEMTIEQKIEQMIMITFRPWTESGEAVSVTSLNAVQKKLIEEHNFNGVCLFADNIRSTAQTISLTSEIQQAAMNSDIGIPMLISADQEGGSIYRLGTGTPTSGNMSLGATRDPSLAYENARIIGSEIKALGINTDLAPVLDVNNNPSNPVINIRSFSSDPDLVREMSMEYIKGLQSEGVITTCKHFPGHGDTGTDSHTGLPLIDKSYDELKKLELVPYTDAVSVTDIIMTAHIQFPQIETETYISKLSGKRINIPATLSKKMITDILRGDYGYDGVVITDAMLMDAIQKNFDTIDSAVLAINADVDIILEPITVQTTSDVAKLEKYVENIAQQVKAGKISEATIDKSVTRILNMKKERGILDYTAPSKEEALKIVGSAENREKALEIAEKGVTLIKNDNDLLPLKLDNNGKVAYFFPYSNVELPMEFTLRRLKKAGILPEGVTADCIWHRYHAASEFEKNIKNSDVVIIAYEMYSATNLDKTNESKGWQAKFTDDLIELSHKNGKKVVLVSANIPYDIARFSNADAILATYCSNVMEALPVDGKENSAYGVNYPAALITVFGGNSPVGKLPVDVYEVDKNSKYTSKILYPFGYGLSYKNTEDNPTTTTTTTSTTTTSTTTSTTTITNPPEITYGDVNCDGKVDAQDATVLNKWLDDPSSVEISEQGKVNGDVYNPGDGLNATDADTILAFYNGTITSLPVVPEPEFKHGDINEDGKINPVDASLILVKFAELSAPDAKAPSDSIIQKYDINGDGMITAVDASLLLAYCAELAEDETVTLDTFLTDKVKK